MKKNIKPIVIGLIAILVLVFSAWILKTPIVSMYLSKKLKADVSMGNINISHRKMEIDNFKIKNPKASKNKIGFFAKKIIADYSLSKAVKEKTVIDTVIVEDSYLIVECFNPICDKNNWTEIIENMKPTKGQKGDKEYLIKKLIFKNISVQIEGIGLLSSVKKTAPRDFEFDNISSKDGFPTQQVIAEIFRSLGLKDFLKGVLEFPGFRQDFLSPFSENQIEKNVEMKKTGT